MTDYLLACLPDSPILGVAEESVFVVGTSTSSIRVVSSHTDGPGIKEGGLMPGLAEAQNLGVDEEADGEIRKVLQEVFKCHPVPTESHFSKLKCEFNSDTLHYKITSSMDIITKKMI